jgi:inner membrane protein
MLLGAAACVLHVLFDALNNYGVHPFFPLDNHWYYGDSVFIVEPLLLMVMLPLLAQRAETRSGRALGWLLSLVLLLLLAWAAQWMPTRLWLALTLALGLCQLLGRLVRIDGRGTLVAVAAVVATFGLASLTAEARLRSELARVAPAEQLLDLASNPFPGNPLCWSTLAGLVLRAAVPDHAARCHDRSTARAGAARSAGAVVRRHVRGRDGRTALPRCALVSGGCAVALRARAVLDLRP